jgi:hypothetical protein
MGELSAEEQVYLTEPSIELKEQYLSFYEEWKESGEDMVPWVISKDPSNFEAMIQFLIDNENEENLPDNWVPDSTYWLVTEDKKIRVFGLSCGRPSVKLFFIGNVFSSRNSHYHQMTQYILRPIFFSFFVGNNISLGALLWVSPTKRLSHAKKNRLLADFYILKKTGFFASIFNSSKNPTIYY